MKRKQPKARKEPSFSESLVEIAQWSSVLGVLLLAAITICSWFGLTAALMFLFFTFFIVFASIL
jgi:hypothetical protein